MNAVLNYGGAVSDFTGSSIYVTVSPCYDCAKMLAQLRIKEVICLLSDMRRIGLGFHIFSAVEYVSPSASLTDTRRYFSS